MNLLLLPMLASVASSCAAPAAENPPSGDTVYVIHQSAGRLLQSDSILAELAIWVRNVAEARLGADSLSPPGVERSLLNAALLADMVLGCWEEGLGRVQALRALPGPAAPLRPVTALLEEALLQARGAAENHPGSDVAPLFSVSLRRALDALDWPMVDSRMRSMRANWSVMSEAGLRGIVEDETESARRRGGTLNLDAAINLLFVQARIELLLPLREVITTQIGEKIAEYDARRPNIWIDRELPHPAAAGVQPVTVAIWDTGVDPEVFPGLMWASPGTPGNGIAYEADGTRSASPLRALDPGFQVRLPEVAALFRGQRDLVLGLSTPEAAAFAQRMSSADGTERSRLLADDDRYSQFAHGTWVASILAAGSPPVRLFVVRDDAVRDDRSPPSIEQCRRKVEVWRDVAGTLKAEGVRIANMSWLVWSAEDKEARLDEASGERDTEANHALAQACYEIERDGLRSLIEGAPDILFVTVAGNDGVSLEGTDHAPATFAMENLLVVGSADQAGKIASFSNTGPSVSLYAFGHGVSGRLPGDLPAHWWGTSSAAPQVSRLAAMLLAARPDLTTRQLRDLILEGATIDPSNGLRLLNPLGSFRRLAGHSR